ncbi:MAG: corrinoid protein [Ignisphaera sp.]|nr:corrinoid protein [Ignisphaera sp.]MCX8167942.1 corrinoid protein [Ignisphaera sp.]MDW8085539.1 corrinoid protein [Ignisphaera sp.]
MSSILDRIRDSVASLDVDSTLSYVRDALNGGFDVKSIIDALAMGMEIVGKRYEEGEYFVSDLIVAGEIFSEAMAILRPKIVESRRGTKPLGKVVIGTVYGDIHDIGKNLVATFLEAAGFEVIDLGVDVPPQKFVEAIKMHSPDIVGMSALLTSTMMHMKVVIEAIKREGLRDTVKVIIGGAPVTEKFAREIGADAYGENAYRAVEICRKLLEKRG